MLLFKAVIAGNLTPPGGRGVARGADAKLTRVSELGDLLELLHGAQVPFTTIRATFRTWTDTERAAAASSAMAEGRGRAAMVMSQGGPRECPRETVEVVRIWRAPGRARVERDHAGYFGVRVGEQWWAWSENSGAVSNEHDSSVGSGVGEELQALLDPTLLLGALRFTVSGRGELAGRRTIRVQAVPRRPMGPNARAFPANFALHTLGSGAERYLLQLDAERGTVLGVEAVRDGHAFRRTEAVGLAFDEHLEDELFVFRPPPGESVRSPRELHSRPEHVPITEAQRRAPFTVLMPARVPAGWQASCEYFEPGRRPATPARVQLSYRSDSAHESLTISQRSAGDADPYPDTEGWQQFDREGTSLEVRTEARRSELRLEREGTAVLMISGNLSTEQLADLALGLVEAPEQSEI